MPSWDVFISYASEDKDAVAEPIAKHLHAAGYRVWLDRQELVLGDSLRAKIDEGLRSARFGIVVLSPRFFQKAWPQRELEAILALEVQHGKRLLPVLHEMDFAALAGISPLLADRVAVSSSAGIDVVVDQIVRAIGSPPSESILSSEAPETLDMHHASGAADMTPPSARLTNEPQRNSSEPTQSDTTDERWARPDVATSTTSRWGTASRIIHALARSWRITGGCLMVFAVLGPLLFWATTRREPRFDSTLTMATDLSSMVPDTSTTATVSTQSHEPVARAIGITNQCTHKSIDVAIRYRDTQQNWVTTGWYQIAPGVTFDTGLVSTSELVYFYGDASDGSTWEWDGDGAEQKKAATVDETDAFTIIDGSTKLKHPKQVIFFGTRFPANAPINQVLDCN
jgi:uncharacterized membrane protein